MGVVPRLFDDQLVVFAFDAGAGVPLQGADGGVAGAGQQRQLYGRAGFGLPRKIILLQ